MGKYEQKKKMNANIYSIPVLKPNIASTVLKKTKRYFLVENVSAHCRGQMTFEDPFNLKHAMIL